MPRREGERSNGSKINQCFDLGNSGYFASKMSTFHEKKPSGLVCIIIYKGKEIQ